MTEQLKPCPFCGGEPTTHGKPNMLGDTLVYCWGTETCGHRGLIMTVEQWQTRAGESNDRTA